MGRSPVARLKELHAELLEPIAELDAVTGSSRHVAAWTIDRVLVGVGLGFASSAPGGVRG